MSPKREVEYRCVECGATVTRGADGVVRKCEHDRAGISAFISATAHGIGRTAQGA